MFTGATAQVAHSAGYHRLRRQDGDASQPGYVQVVVLLQRVQSKQNETKFFRTIKKPQWVSFTACKLDAYYVIKQVFSIWQKPVFLQSITSPLDFFTLFAILSILSRREFPKNFRKALSYTRYVEISTPLFVFPDQSWEKSDIKIGSAEKIWLNQGWELECDTNNYSL